VHEFTAYYRRRLAEYAARGSFPVNGAVEIRVTGLDDPGQLGLPGPAPALSAVRPAAGHPEWDVAVWLDVLTLPGTPEAEAFLRDIERFVFATYDGSWAAARVEWSKGWAYTEEAGWADPDVLHRLIPASLPGWSAAVDTLDRLDPHRVFTNPFLDRLLRHPA
jgi:FAD/FMN-containing dehydrogenase